MKKQLSLVLGTLLLNLSAYNIRNPALNPLEFQTPVSHGSLQLVKDGKLNFAVVTDRNVENHLRKQTEKVISIAVDTLVREIEKSTGRKPEVFDVLETENIRKYPYCLMIGESNLTKQLGIKTSDLPPEGFMVKSFPSGVAIVGNDSSLDKTFNTGDKLSMRGVRSATLWGVYDFLERFFGCRFYFPGEYGSLHPTVKTLEIQPFSYTDKPHFRNRGQYYLAQKPKKAEQYLGKLSPQSVTEFCRSVRQAKTEPFTGMHSPFPILWSKANPDKTESSFFRNLSGHLYYSTDSHAGNYYDITNLRFADNLIDSLKRFYASGGNDTQGWGYNNDFYIVFGQADSEVTVSEMLANKVVKQENLITRENLNGVRGQEFSDIYARFYQYLAGRIQEEFPKKKLIIMPYSRYTHPPLNPKYHLPDNVEVALCLAKFPRWIRNPEVRKEYRGLLAGWYKTLGNRPVQQLWTYNANNNAFTQAISTGLMGEVIKFCDYYLGNTEIFHEFNLWPSPEIPHYHFYYATYVAMRSLWNPDFNCDAAIEEHWIPFYGKTAGENLKQAYGILKDNYFKFASPAQDPKPLYPPVVLDELEKCLNRAEKSLSPDSIERKRYELFAMPLRGEISIQRKRHAYNPPLYCVRQLSKNETVNVDGYRKEAHWAKTSRIPMLDPGGTGKKPEFPPDLRLAWTKEGIYGFMNMPHAPKTDGKNMWKNCNVEIFISPGTEINKYFQIALDPKGQTASMTKQLKPFITAGDSSWKCKGFLSAGRINATGWDLEFFIPFSALNTPPPKPYDSWKFNFVCNKHSNPSELSGSSITLGNNHNVNMYGLIKFLGKGE